MCDNSNFVALRRAGPHATRPSSRLRDPRWIAAALVCVLGLSGCGTSGPALSPVAGKVTFRGTPVKAGIVRFSNPQAGIDTTAQLQPDGAYHVATARGIGLPEGTYQVAIMPPEIELPKGPLTQIAPPPTSADIPAKYRLPATSGIALTVKPGDNRLDVDMQP